MKPALVRLLLVSALFLGWLGYLGVLVATRPVTAGGWPLVVSQPQILTSQLDIIGTVESPDGEVVVEEVLWPTESALKPGARIRVENLADAGPARRVVNEPPPRDFSGPGRYLLPLQIVAEERYQIAPVPPSPGFNALLFRFYPATAEAIAQYRRIGKSE